MKLGQGWTRAHAKEQEFQQSKRLTRFMEAMEQGYPVPNEETAGNKEALGLWTEHQAEVARRYDREKASNEARQALTFPKNGPLMELLGPAGKGSGVDFCVVSYS